ncbi:arf-GAP with Rho-GAP domain, ANK repeat and PH domain-containing protein 2 [Zerene cesonia]|uniref:arf-GAP with Rho-GAP domain, ANK repeat and PH domain-containing protein 2 n=1 Tax=Zerene cesonia TaxID=33412 RepID=UPI0018E4FFAF|nr:arf-GAP with Rho-GAP domain, ANK repeat and PH domain-containing protein 2 [Zerene cesonia]
MDSPPVPKPRSSAYPQTDPLKRPIPLPRTKVPNNDRVTASELLKSIGSVSKQITEDVAHKVSSSAKTANEKIEKSIMDGSKFAKDTIEKTINTSKAVRASVTKSVIEGTKTAGLKIRRSKKFDSAQDEDPQRCVSMPAVDVSLFDNIQFHSPLLEQKRLQGDEGPSTKDNPTSPYNILDNQSLFSNNSDSIDDSASNISQDGTEFDQNESISNFDLETYDTPKPSRANSFISVRSAPEVPGRRKKRASQTEFMRQNSMYENWTLPHPTTKPQPVSPETIERPSKSTIYEFDPLNFSASPTNKKYEGVSNELLLLESFLIGDTYGTIVSNDIANDETFDFVESDYFNPPTPPERFDSLVTGETSVKPPASTNDKDTNSNWYVGVDSTSVPETGDEVKTNSSVMQRFSNMLKLDNVLNKSSKQSVSKVETVERPPINKLPVPYYSGTLNKVVSGVVEDLFKNSQSRYCVLSDQKIMCYTDPTNSIVKEVYTLDSINSIQIVLPLSSSTTNNNYCFELSISMGMKSTPKKVLFGCGSASERRNWGQKIVEHLTNGFPTKYMSEFTRCGWCYMKEGVTGEWRGAWLMLVRRVLVYCTAPDTLCIVDLRKTRCVVNQDADEETKQKCPSDGSPNLLLDCPHATLYLHFQHEKELKGWRYMLKLAAHNNGAYLHHQQLTKDDVPAIVDKCISFIYAHGSLSEGIYRRAGSSLVLSELLGRFRRDAWSVVLSPAQHSEHDVAGVLKRFFRDLPESLVPQDKHQALTAALDIKDEQQRNAAYKEVMLSLPLVARNTARKLFAHLHFLHTMAHANKMNAENLASVWAPTIMPTALTSHTLPHAWSAREQQVVRDLIARYAAVWQPTEAEERREAAVRRVLAAVLGRAAPPAPRAAGDLRAWLYVRDRAHCRHVALTPSKTSADICIELAEKAKMESHLMMIEEVICNESMRRIVHKDEVVLDVVLRWSYWDEEDRKDNYLIIKDNKTLHDMENLKHSTSVCGELRVANETTKTFKTHMFECGKSKLCYFKDKQGSHKLEEWNVKDILWYNGHEPKRNPQSRWAITFIPRNDKQKRSKDRPWFGCTIAGAVTEDQLKWMAALMFGEHSSILPTPRLVIT